MPPSLLLPPTPSREIKTSRREEKRERDGEERLKVTENIPSRPSSIFHLSPVPLNVDLCTYTQKTGIIESPCLRSSRGNAVSSSSSSRQSPKFRATFPAPSVVRRPRRRRKKREERKIRHEPTPTAFLVF